MEGARIPAEKVTRLCSVSLFLSLWVLSGGARAQAAHHNRLRGVSAVQVMVETSGEVASCGVRDLSGTSVRVAMMTLIRASLDRAANLGFCGM
jgi:hypothetical protein